MLKQEREREKERERERERERVCVCVKEIQIDALVTSVFLSRLLNA